MDLYYLFVIIATLVGFCGLAWLLLAPIWRFLDREEQVSEDWTKEALARRRSEQQRASDEARKKNAAAGTDRPPQPPRTTPSGDGATAPRDEG